MNDNREEACTGSALKSVTRNLKHLDINESINGIDSAIYRARDLLGRINGGKTDVPRCDKSDDPEPNLLDVLDCAPETIRSKSNEINSILAEIESTLFGE